MKTLFEQKGITYREEGNYLLPNLIIPDIPRIGKYGILRHSYLRNHKSPVFTTLLMTEKLNSHLEEIDKKASEMLETLVRQMKKEENVTEKLKADNQFEWAQKMNSIHKKAEEIVLVELIYD